MAKVTFIQASIFLSLSLGYAAAIQDLAAIGLSATGWETALASGGLLFLAAVPFLYLPTYFGLRNELEEVLVLKLTLGDLLLLNLVVSWGEELFFRGLLVRVVGVVPSALLFGAMHYVGYRSVLEVVYAVSTGLALGYLFKAWLPNILFPVTFHFLANFASMLLTKRRVGGG